MSHLRKSSLSPCLMNKENKNVENIITFKNICDSKRIAKFKDHSPCQSNDQSLYLMINNSKKSEDDLKLQIKSKNKQIASLHSQVKVLENTVKLLHNQSNHPSNKIQQPLASFNKEKSYEIIEAQNLRLRQQLTDFQQIVPKLNELEQIQSKLIEQNKRLKSNQQIMRSVLKNIKTLMSNTNQASNAIVCELIKTIIQ